MSEKSESEATGRAVAASRAGWVNDLSELLRAAQRRFSDVSWRIDGEREEIHGHKGESEVELHDMACAQADGSMQPSCTPVQTQHFKPSISIPTEMLGCRRSCLDPICRYTIIILALLATPLPLNPPILHPGQSRLVLQASTVRRRKDLYRCQSLSTEPSLPSFEPCSSSSIPAQQA